MGGWWWFTQYAPGTEKPATKAPTPKRPAPPPVGITNPPPATKPISPPASATINTTPAAPPANLPDVNTNTALISTNPPAPPPSSTASRPVQDVFEAQLALARRGISCGSLDGVMGSQTKAGLRAFQHSKSLPASGLLDDATRRVLLLTPPAFTNYIVNTNDLARLRPLPRDWLGKSGQASLDYETILELVAEKSWSHPAFIKELNPGVNWAAVPPNTAVRVPNVAAPPDDATAAFIRISLSGRSLEVFDARTNLLVHFPCSIAHLVEKRPVGRFHVVLVIPNPNYMFNPENFPESEEARRIGRKLLIPPGPNNPVGTVWIGLDKPGYGIHGTPVPEEVGRTESHGCFRLANWNVETLTRFVLVGTPVYVVP